MKAGHMNDRKNDKSTANGNRKNDNNYKRRQT